MIRDLQQDIKQKEKRLYHTEIASTCQKETFDRTFELYQAQILQLEADKTCRSELCCQECTHSRLLPEAGQSG